MKIYISLFFFLRQRKEIVLYMKDIRGTSFLSRTLCMSLVLRLHTLVVDHICPFLSIHGR